MSRGHREKYLKMFSDVDADNNGVIDINELATVLQMLGKDKVDLEKTFAAVDTDGNGTIDQTEFLAFMQDVDNSWVRVQEKTFTRWANTILGVRLISIDSISKDFIDGTNLVPLVEILMKKSLGKYNKKPRMKVQRIENLSKCLDYLKKDGVKLVNIGPGDLEEGNINITLGLIWMLILKYQIGDSCAQGTPKWLLLEWVRKQIKPYKLGVKLKNFKSGWSDGKVLSALTDSLGGDINQIINTEELDPDPHEATKIAMSIASEKFEIPEIMDPADLVENPEEHSIMTYISYFRDYADTVKNTVVPIQTTAEGPGIEGGDATLENAEFVVICKNTLGQQVSGGDHDVKVTVTGPDGEEKKCELIDNKDGTYGGRYDLSGAGNYTVDITVKDEPIMNSPFTAEMKAGCATKCYVDGEGLANGKTGRNKEFTIHSVNQMGDPITVGGVDPFVVEIIGPNGKVPANMVDQNNGTYPVTYCPEDEGEYTINVTLLGEAIKDSPFSVNIKRAPNASKSYVEGPGLKKVWDNREATFTVHAMDDLGDSVWGDDCEVIIKPEDPDAGLEAIDAKVEDNKDGTYSVSYSPPDAGDFVVTVLLDKDTVEGTPLKISVKEGADSQNIPEAKFLVTIMTRNKKGEPKTEGGDQWEVEVKGPRDEEIKADAIDNGDGSYSCAYTLKRKQNEENTEPSEYLVKMMLNGEHIAGSPFKQFL